MNPWYLCSGCGVELGRSFDKKACSKCGREITSKQVQTLAYFRKRGRPAFLGFYVYPAIFFLALFAGVLLFSDSFRLVMAVLLSIFVWVMATIVAAVLISTSLTEESQKYHDRLK